MDINQLTANIARQQLQLEQQIGHLQQQLNTAKGEAADTLSRDLASLESLRAKLIKSREIALQAHALQLHQSHSGHSHKRALGLALCAFSGLGLLALAAVALLP